GGEDAFQASSCLLMGTLIARVRTAIAMNDTAPTARSAKADGSTRAGVESSQTRLEMIARSIKDGMTGLKRPSCACWKVTKLDGESLVLAKVTPMRSPS